MNSSSSRVRSLFLLAATLAFTSTVSACGHHKKAVAPSDCDDDDDDCQHKGPSAKGGKGDDAADFDESVRKVRQAMQSQPHGVAVVAQYLQEKTQKRLSLVYVDPEPPLWKDAINGWVIESRANIDDQPVSTVTFLLPQLAAGHFEGSASRKDVWLGASLGVAEWNPTADETAWSLNEDGWCSVDLKEAGTRGDLEGKFKGKLVANKGGTYYLLEKGYIYIRR